jgi:hypothetical protein
MLCHRRRRNGKQASDDGGAEGKFTMPHVACSKGKGPPPIPEWDAGALATENAAPGMLEPGVARKIKIPDGKSAGNVADQQLGTE